MATITGAILFGERRTTLDGTLTAGSRDSRTLVEVMPPVGPTLFNDALTREAHALANVSNPADITCCCTPC
ncbi:hypothetical protein PISMIDRAFT_674682 [Pisolithus microcarpus 441]|uniref:Uncharacterized protein n=1 Tax=Pisolithus microcarpus 441 TaxID=765257 RepID=A0A0C9ZEK1_9AGAM|nr:hypothetical protein PISMIDRAFT_674682 [Pisolithus microcarpus 441]